MITTSTSKTPSTMPQIYLKNAFLRLNEHPILDHVNLNIEAGDKIAIVGRNGAGKSTLLKILAQQLSPDAGECIIERNTAIAYFQQDNYPQLTGPIGTALIGHLDEDSTGSHYWSIQNHIKKYLQALHVDEHAAAENLSGGQLRRAWLAYTLALEADILCLDEPTNHLDLPTLAWLEETVKKNNATLLLISHDRSFMQHLCSRFIDIEHGQLKDFQGNYDRFLQFREDSWAAEATAIKQANKVLAQEEAWIRQGIKARRTRNEGRVRRLQAMREQARARRQKQGNIQLQHHQVSNTGKALMILDQLAVGYPSKTMLKPFNSIVFRGDAIAIIGPNGSGKTSLIRTLLAEQEPLQGNIKKRHDLRIAYFDQTKQILKDNETVFDFVSDGRTHIEIGEQRIHIHSYLKQFLFDHQTSTAKIHTLSGGKKNRVLLAYALSFAVDLLILDEPTNDLDIETLELLENYLSEAKTTLLFTSHDKAFINAVASTLWVIQPDHTLLQFDGSYDDWLQFSKQQQKQTIKSPSKLAENKPKPKQKSNKLSYHEKRALELLPAKIEKLEQALETLQQEITQPEFYKNDPAYIKDQQNTLSALQADIQQCYDEWEALTLKENSC